MKLVIILLIAILILIIAIIVQNKNQQQLNEGFKNNSRKKISFLVQHQVCNIIRTDVKYFENLTEIDKLARQKLLGGDIPENTDEIIKTYCYQIENFSDENKELINNTLKRIEYKNKILFSEWSIARVSEAIEDGYPHTHKNTIFISEEYINSNRSTLLNTLIHEQIHVCQRKHERLFTKLYLEYFPFKQGRLKLNKETSKFIRANPDTEFNKNKEFLYVEKNGEVESYYYLCALYNSIMPTDLGDVNYAAIKCNYDEKTDTYTETETIVEITELPGFKYYFNISVNHYHPNEISAHLIAEYYTTENPDPKKMSPALKSIEKWLNEEVI